MLQKHKDSLCTHRGMQKWGNNYWKTYPPGVKILSIKHLLSIAKIYNLDPKSIDLVPDFPQVDLKVDIWMYLPIGVQVDDMP